MEVYVTLAEAAELEEIKYNSMVQKVGRNPDKYSVKTEKGVDGGKNRVLVSVSTLSKSAQGKWKEREKLRQLAEQPVDEDADQQPDIMDQAPWYVATDIEWYMTTYKEQYAKGVDLKNIVTTFLTYNDAGRTQYAEDYARQYLGKDKRTLYRYISAYNEALAWANRLEKEDGCSYEFFCTLALCRKPKQTGLFPSLLPEMKQAINNIWFDKEFAANRNTKETLYLKLEQLADLNGWEYLPSYQTVVRYVNWLMGPGRMKNAHMLAADGMKTYKNKAVVKASRSTKDLLVMEIVMGDEHTFDLWVSYQAPNGKVKPIRPVLVAWVDVRTRTIMGDIICEHANSQILKQSLLKMLYQEHGGVPKYLYIDNGKDYTSFEMTGRSRKERHGNELAFDEDARGFYQSIGIIDDHRAKPYEAWNKGEVERFFRTVCNQFSKLFTSYTGTLTSSKTSDKVPKDIQKMFEQGKLFTMEEFYQKWSEWLNTYMHKLHSGLKKAGEEWTNPWDLWENGEHYEKAVPAKSYATLLMMKEQNVLVRNVGIIRAGYEYRADELCDFIGEKVNIRYDPDDMSVLYVFGLDGKRICEAYSQELLQFGKVSENELNHIKMQNRQIQRDRERLADANIPFEQIHEQYKGFSSTVGGLDLMNEAKPSKSKTVAFPNSKLYRENPDMRGSKTKEEEEQNSFIMNAGKEAMEKLRRMEG